MSLTIVDLRQAVGQELNECVVGEADGGTTTTVVDADLQDSEESSSKYQHWWIRFNAGLAAGDVRRVSAYTPSTGTLTVSRAFTGAPVAGNQYEIHGMLSPDDLDRLINQGIERLTYIVREEITAVSGQRNYDLSSYDWLLTPDQVVDVLWKQGNTANKYRYRPLPWYEVVETWNTLELHIRPYSVTAGDKLVLEAIRAYAPLEGSTTTCPEDWAVAAALVEVYDWLARTDPAQDAEQIRQWRASAARRLTRLSNRYAPKPARRIQHRDSVRGGWPSDVAV